MSAVTIHELAEQIADDLFTNGDGKRADRLVLTADGPPRRDLGGWSRRAVMDRVAAIPQARARISAGGPVSRDAAPPWTAEERAVIDDLKARAGLPTDEALIALALYRLANWYNLWPSAQAFAIGFTPAQKLRPKAKRG